MRRHHCGDDGWSVIALARGKLMVFTVDELLAEADKAKTRDQRIWALYQPAAAAEAEPDARVVGTFERALQQDDPDIRRATLVAIGTF
jgi:hypothetical protein